MSPSHWKILCQSLGLAVVLFFGLCIVAIAQPLPVSTHWIAQAPVEKPATARSNRSDSAPPSVNNPETSDREAQNRSGQNDRDGNSIRPPSPQAQSSGGPYDLKTIEESYRSLYGS